MKRTADLSSKTKTELTAMARRKKIPVTSGMLKDELIRVIKKGLRKIEAQKKSKTTQRASKKKSTKTSKVKTARKSTGLKKSLAKKKTKKTPAKKTVAKKSVTRKPKTVRSPKAGKSRPSSKPVETDLPEQYGDHRLVLLARDPNWAYAYWDLNATKVRDLLKNAGQTPDKARWLLRVYSCALHPVEDKQHYFDVDTDVRGGNYYLNLSKPGGRFVVEIGVMDITGLFRSTAQSNPIILPMDHPSDTFAQERVFSEDITSPSVSSFMKPPSRSE